jgi:tripartite-type tricarboxylate transporter receptor subunit TctC
VTDLLGNQVTMSFDTVTPVLQHIRSGKLRALAVTHREARLGAARRADPRGGRRQGHRHRHLVRPARAGSDAREVVARLNAEAVKVIQSPDFKKRMDEIGAEPVGNTSEQMAAQIRSETEKFARLVKDAKVTID